MDRSTSPSDAQRARRPDHARPDRPARCAWHRSSGHPARRTWPYPFCPSQQPGQRRQHVVFQLVCEASCDFVIGTEQQPRSAAAERATRSRERTALRVCRPGVSAFAEAKQCDLESGLDRADHRVGGGTDLGEHGEAHLEWSKVGRGVSLPVTRARGPTRQCGVDHLTHAGGARLELAVLLSGERELLAVQDPGTAAAGARKLAPRDLCAHGARRTAEEGRGFTDGEVHAGRTTSRGEPAARRSRWQRQRMPVRHGLRRDSVGVRPSRVVGVLRVAVVGDRSSGRSRPV